jgi:Ohr subfamily peroxiredoxin
MTTSLTTKLYTAHTHVTDGRNKGHGRSSDGELDVALSTPGLGKPGTNPEQLFGVAYSACFLSAVLKAAAERKVQLPEHPSVDADVTLGKTGADEFQLAVKLQVNLPGLDAKVKRELIEAADHICPYSRMTRGNVEVELATA